MRTRLLSLFLAVLSVLGVVASAESVHAAPEVHILRIDPRASQVEGTPVLTTVVELVQNKRMSEAIADCATMRGDAQLDCQSDKLEAPQALYSPLAPFPEGATFFSVEVDGQDRPSTFVSKARWGESVNQAGVGTAWLLLIDAASTMGNRFEEAKAVASAFVSSMTPGDIVNVMFFNDRQVVTDSKWQAAAAKQQVLNFVSGLRSTYPVQGRVRPLFNIVKQAATDGFRELGNVGTNVQVPLHQAMVILSNGYAGSDPTSTGPATTVLNDYLTKGRFPEDNTVQPKTPLPVISVWFPMSTYDEFKQNSQEFMQGLANTDIGGFYDVVRAGQGAAKGPKLVNTVRTRFNQMSIVKWRVSCIAPTVTQTFKMVFSNTSTPILGDSTFKDVPMGVDPTAWPLDVNVDYTQKMAKRDTVQPGGTFTVYGNFCWGGEKDRAEVYFIPAGTQPPAAIAGGDLQAAQRTQQQLIASGMRGRAGVSSDSDVSFEAPDKDNILSGSGDAAVVRLVVYDNKAHRASGVTAASILTLAGSPKSIPWPLIVGGAFGLVVVALLMVIMLRGGKRRPAGAAPQPMIAGLAPVVAQPGGMAAYAHAPSPSPYGAPGGSPMPYGGGAPHGYGAPAGSATRATLSGPAGVYTVLPGFEMRVGRDNAHCQVILQEPRISGVHATLKFEGGQLYVRDENSNNGTLVGGNRIAPGAWTAVPGNVALAFGPVEFMIRLE